MNTDHEAGKTLSSRRSSSCRFCCLNVANGLTRNLHNLLSRRVKSFLVFLSPRSSGPGCRSPILRRPRLSGGVREASGRASPVAHGGGSSFPAQVGSPRGGQAPVLGRWSRGRASRPQAPACPTAGESPVPPLARRAACWGGPCSAAGAAPLGQSALPALRLLKTSLGERGAAVRRRGTRGGQVTARRHGVGGGRAARRQGGRAPPWGRRTPVPASSPPARTGGRSVGLRWSPAVSRGSPSLQRRRQRGENFVKARQFCGCFSKSNSELGKKVAPSHLGGLGCCSSLPAVR